MIIIKGNDRVRKYLQLDKRFVLNPEKIKVTIFRREEGKVKKVK